MGPAGEETELLDSPFRCFWLIEDLAINLCHLVSGEDETVRRAE
jgi:hypothetical protein